MNFRDFLLNEMPISNLTMRGDWRPDARRKYGFNRQDAGILSSERGVEKIRRAFSNNKQEFDFYFIREKGAYKHLELGEVSPEWVKQNLNMDIEPREDAITVLFTNNTAAEKMPMTAWTIGHRLGHAFRRNAEFENYFSKEVERDFRELLKMIYNYQAQEDRMYTYGGYYGGYGQTPQPRNRAENVMRALAYAVGTMKSARDRNLRNFNEFVYELVAQYVTTGHIRFNPLPKTLILNNRQAWGRPNPDSRWSRLDAEEMQEWNQILEQHAKKYEEYLDSVFSSLTGRIFVM